MESMTNGTGEKYDGGKIMFSLLTRGLAAPLRAVAAVLTYGAIKYSPGGWKDVPDAIRRYEDALDRHMNALRLGEQRDEESGMLHWAHVATNALFLLYFEIISDPGMDYTTFNDPKGEKDGRA
jgi:hypothetical protein